MAKDDVIYKVEINLTEEDVQQVVDLLNSHNDEDEDWKTLTIDEIKSKPELLQYMVDQLAFYDQAFYDIEGIWNNDGWSDIQNYR